MEAHSKIYHHSNRAFKYYAYSSTVMRLIKEVMAASWAPWIIKNTAKITAEEQAHEQILCFSSSSGALFRNFEWDTQHVCFERRDLYFAVILDEAQAKHAYHLLFDKYPFASGWQSASFANES